MSSEDLQELCTREEWPISTLTDIFVSKVRCVLLRTWDRSLSDLRCYSAMHADRKIKQQMEQQNAASSTVISSTAHPSTALASALKEEASSEKDPLPYMKERQKQFTKLFLDLLSKTFFRSVFVMYSCDIQTAACPKKTSASQPLGRRGPTSPTNLNSLLRDGIRLWLILPFPGILLLRRSPTCSGSTSRLWSLRGSWRLSPGLQVSQILFSCLTFIWVISSEQKLIPESEACFGEIPVVINSDGLPMVVVKDSTKWVRDNCSITAPAKKRERKGDTSSPINSFPPSPASSTKKRSYDTAMSPPEEQLNHKSTREYRPLPRQAEVGPAAKRQRHITFASLPDNMFYTKLRRASHPISFFNPLKNQKTPASSSCSVSQPSTSSSAQARVSGKCARPGKHSGGFGG